MKKIIPLIVVGIMVLGGLGAVAATRETIQDEKISVSFSQPSIERDSEFITISLDESNQYIMEKGKPILPSYVQTFTYPFGTKIKSVSISPRNIQTQTITDVLKPTPQTVAIGQKITSKANNQLVDYGTEPYPSNWFDYDVKGGLVRGELSVVLKVQINPIKYHPAENTIEYIKDADILIDYEPSDYQPSALEDYQLLVIAPNEFSDELAPLISHKNGRDVPAKFVGLNEIYGGDGRDNQEKIKFYIRDAIEESSITNVLLVGSSSKLPARSVYVWIDEEDEQGSVEVFVSDLYYADIYDGEGDFLDWDSTNNNRFGEFEWDGETDEVDLLPDVYLGRWPCTTGSQVTACVNKVITYENNEAYKSNWFTRIVTVGGDTSPGYETPEGEFMNEKIINLMDGFSEEKIWASNGKLTSWAPTGVSSIQNAINDGCGFAYFSGHGNTNVWATHPIEKNNWIPTPTQGIFSTQISSLSNGNKLPIVIVEACSTAKFAADSNTFNWAFMYDSNGGGIGTFGCTALGWGYVGTGVSSGLIGKMGYDTFKSYMLDDSITLGQMWYNALDRYIKSNMEQMDMKVTEEWILFGDPTLQIGEESQPPAIPDTPKGPSSGSKNQELTYISKTTDPEDDDVFYLFDWGDGTDSGWIGPEESGKTVTAKKTWTVEGTFQIKVSAKDDNGKISGWSDEMEVAIPRSKPVNRDTEGTFSAEMGIRGSTDPDIVLDGNYKQRNRYKVIWGTATADEKEGNFRGVFISNHLIVKVPTPRATITVLGRCSFDGEDFSGNWISRAPFSRGWIEGDFTPS